MKTDFVGRVSRFPEPRGAAEALQPFFEAVMNAIHSTQDKFGKRTANLGRIEIVIEKANENNPLTITIQDNGNGLDDENYAAFLTVDTEHKKVDRGGKGVGRLLWLSCFGKIQITSDYRDKDQKKRRSFDFTLRNEDQFQNEVITKIVSKDSETSFTVKFLDLKNNGYREKFPQRPVNLFQHFLSHFLPVMVGSMCPKITITYNSESVEFPKDVQQYVKRRKAVPIQHKEHALTMEMLECDKVVSKNLQGYNFVHFIAHDRTVKSQPIDGKLGLKIFAEDNVFHALLSGDFLNSHVNQERTQFTFEQDVIEEIINMSCIPQINDFLSEPLQKVKQDQLQELSKIVNQYPSIGFEPIEQLAQLVAPGETRDEQLFGALSVHRYRRDEKQREKMALAIEKLKNEKLQGSAFEKTVKEASSEMLESEKRSLAEYVVRRRVMIEFLRHLLNAVKHTGSDSDFELESTLHNFICPIRIKSPSVEASSHDLWVVDERLTFATAFGSDLPLQELLEASENGDRPDVIVFDNAYGLNHGTNDPHALIVEFKRPGREKYADNENPQFQIEKYIREISSHQATNLNGRPIRLAENVRFHCFLIADRLGKIADWTSSWAPTADGRGRVYELKGDYKGFIELIEWDQLINDAEMRNSSFFNAAGLFVKK